MYETIEPCSCTVLLPCVVMELLFSKRVCLVAPWQDDRVCFIEGLGSGLDDCTMAGGSGGKLI